MLYDNIYNDQYICCNINTHNNNNNNNNDDKKKK